MKMTSSEPRDDFERDEHEDAAERAALEARQEALLAARMGELEPAGRTVKAKEPAVVREARRGRKLGARFGVGVLALAAASGLVVWSLTPFIPARSVTIPSTQVAPVPGTQERVCPGPLAALGQQGGSTAATLVGDSKLAGAGDTGSAEAIGIHAANGSGTGALKAPVLYTAPGMQGDVPTRLSAAQTTTVSAPLAGFAAASCQQPSADQWVLADGSTGTTSSVLSVTNSSERAAKVTLTAFSENGQIAMNSNAEFEIPARTQRLVSLAGLAPEQKWLAVHVQASSGLISASIHETVSERTNGQGADIVGATEAPTLGVVIPGVPVTAQPSRQDDGGGAQNTLVRLVSPQGDANQATVRILDHEGKEVHHQTMALQAGVVAEMQLSLVTPGVYTVVVDAEAPVLAAARAGVVAEKSRDFAWYRAAPVLSGDQLVAVPEGPGARISLYNPKGEAQQITVAREGGEAETVTIAPGATHRVDASAGNYHLGALHGIAATVSYSGAGQLAGFAVTSTNPLAEPIEVVR